MQQHNSGQESAGDLSPAEAQRILLLIPIFNNAPFFGPDLLTFQNPLRIYRRQKEVAYHQHKQEG